MATLDESDELTKRARSRLGERLRDRWLLDELLGVGGMAAVYAATHRNGKRVAVKILHREIAFSEDARARFLREGYVANAVEHEGAVIVLDEDLTEDGAPFFVMDLFDGETLDQRLRRKGPLDVEEVLSTTYHLLDVLAAAHAKGIVHRDIKPENVFLTNDAGIKVLDFGIAQLRESAAATTTQVGRTMGTPSFMSPEQARGRWDEVDARSDVWSVGATMFTLLTGRHVHVAETMNEVLLGAMATPAESIALHRGELPREVCALVDRALSFDKADRWESARAMQSAIRETYAAMQRSSSDWARAPAMMAASEVDRAAPSARAPMEGARPRTTARPTTAGNGREGGVRSAWMTGMVVAVAVALVVALGVWAVGARSGGGGQARGAASAAARGGESGKPRELEPPQPETVHPPAPGTVAAAVAPAVATQTAAAAVVRPHPLPRRVVPPAPPASVTPAATATTDPLERRH